MSVGGGPQYLDGRGLAHAILDWVLWQTLFIELNPFRIPVNGRLVDCGESFGHQRGIIFLFPYLTSFENQVSIKAVITVPY